MRNLFIYLLVLACIMGYSCQKAQPITTPVTGALVPIVYGHLFEIEHERSAMLLDSKPRVGYTLEAIFDSLSLGTYTIYHYRWHLDSLFNKVIKNPNTELLLEYKSISLIRRYYANDIADNRLRVYNWDSPETIVVHLTGENKQDTFVQAEFEASKHYTLNDMYLKASRSLMYSTNKRLEHDIIKEKAASPDSVIYYKDIPLLQFGICDTIKKKLFLFLPYIHHYNPNEARMYLLDQSSQLNLVDVNKYIDKYNCLYYIKPMGAKYPSFITFISNDQYMGGEYLYDTIPAWDRYLNKR